MTTNKPEINISNYTPVIYETAVDFGNAVSLDGVDDYVSIPDSDNIDFGTDEDFTVEAWVKADSNQADLGNSDNDIIEKWNGSGGYPFVIRYARTTGKIIAARYDGSSSGNVPTITSTTSINDNEFHHVAFVKNGDTLSLYINGNLEGTTTDTTTASTQNTSPLHIGNRANKNHFKGEVDELRIWNNARTETEIQDNLYQKLDGAENALVAYYNFDEDSVDDNTISDITDNANNGTLTNGDETNFVDSEIPTFKGHVDIELNSKVSNQPGVILNYQIESDSTATQDEDFYNSQTDVSTTDSEPQTDSIFIAEGEDSARIYLTALPDAVVEGDENIKLTLLPDFNKALDLDGVNDYVESQPSNFPTTEITLEGWFKRTDNQGLGTPLLSYASSDLNNNEVLLYEQISTNSILVFIGNTSIDTNIAIPDEDWHHWAVTWRSSDGQVLLYRDGTQVFSGNVSQGDVLESGGTLVLGQEQDSVGGGFASDQTYAGLVDEVRIWNTARTETEIQDTLYATLNGDETNLVAYYNFNDDSVEGNTISDVTTNSNDGTLQDNSNLALSLDGVDDYVAVSSQLPTTNTITIEARIKPILDGTWNPILNYDGWSTGDIHLQFRPNNQLQFHINGTNSKISSYNFNSNEWYDIAVIYSSLDSFLQIFVNGESIDYFSYFDDGVDAPNVAANSFKIGGWSDNNGNLSRLFNGEIDQVRIWASASDTRVKERYSATSIDPNGSLGYYTFNDGTANDLSSSNRNGTVNGASFVDSSNLVVADNLTNSVVYDPFATNGATYGIQSTQSAEITIQDSDNYVVDIVIANKFEEDLSDAANYVVVDENGDATFQVKLTSQPTQDVTVSISIDGTNNELTFTPNDWDTYQSVTVSGISNGSNITLTNTVGNYTNQTKQLSVSAKSNDEVTILELTEGGAELELTPTVSISATNPEATEGNETESGVFTVSLDTPAPEGGLVIPFSVSSTATEGTDYNLYADSFTYSGESALSFDGLDDYVQLGNESNFDITSKITLEAWIKVDNFDINYQTIVSKGDGSWRLQRNGTNNTLQFGIGSGSSRYINGTKAVNDGQWHHVAGVYDGTKLKLYIDGVLDIEQDASGSISTNNYNVLIGENEERPGRYFEGQIDEVRIWETARTEEEIQQNLYSKLEGTEDGLAAYYNFDELNENISDVTGNGNDGTPYIGQSLSLDGSDDYVSIPDSDNIDFGTDEDFTVEAWIKADSNQADLGNGDNDIIEKWSGGGVGYPFVIRYLNASGKIIAARYDGSTTRNNPNITSNTTINDNEFHHVAFIKEGETLSLYIDGNLEGTTTDTTTNSTQNTSPLHIGNRANRNHFAGEVDELRIWNKARTQTEIQENLYNKLEGTEENLVAYYNFDNDSGTTITDSTANANNGTLNNGDGNNLVASTIGYPLTDWETTKTPVVKIAEGETEATITVSKIDNEIAEAADEDVTVTLEYGKNYDLNTSKQSAFITLKDDDTAGIEFAKLDTVGSVDNIAQEFIVSNDYDTTTGQVGLTLNNGNNSYTFAAGTELTFDGGAVVTVDSQTTIAATGETLLNVTFASDSPTQEITADEISEIELVNIELSSFATTDTDAIAIFNVSLAQAPTEDVTVTLTDANGTATGTVSFTTSNWDISQSVRMTVEEGTSESAFNLGVSTTTATQGDINYGVTPEGFSFANRAFDIPISTETVATSLEFYNNTVVTSEVATIELEVTSDYANGNVGLKLASGADSYTLTAGTQLSFTDGAVVTVDTDTILSTDDAGTPVSVSFVNAIAAQETISFTDEQSGTAIEVQVNTAYNATTGEVGLQISSGVNELTFSNGTELTFSSGAVVTVTQDTTLSSLTETSVPVSFSNQIITDETTEIELPGEDSTNFAVRLSSQPTDSVDLTLTIGDSTEGEFANSSSNETLNFTTENWDTYQQVTLYGVDDTEDDGNLEYSITSTATSNDLNYNDTTNSISVSNQDNDEAIEEVDDIGNSSSIIASLSTVNSEIAEGSTEQALKVTLSEAAPAGGLKVRYTVSGGTATPDEDFVDLQGFVERSADENPLSESQIGLLSNNEDDGTISLTLADIDGDGDFDASTALADGSIRYLENIGSASLPEFEERTDSENPFDSYSEVYSITFGDLNGDDKPDALLVEESGVYYLENTTANGDTIPSFAQTTSLNINLGSNYLVDIDNDGSLELFVGLSDGTISYYENTTTGTTPTFDEQTTSNSLDGVDVEESAAPNFIDYDGDGDFDVAINNSSTIYYYENVGTASNPDFVARTGIDNPFDNVSMNGFSPSLALADINDDEDIDVFVSSKFSGIEHYENTFFQEVEIAQGETEATIDINTIADNIAEYDETIEVSLSAKPSQAYSFTVTQDYAVNLGTSIGTIGLKLDGTETELVGIPGGTVLTFSNGATFKVSGLVTLSSQESGTVAGELISGTSIINGETTDFTDEGYRLVDDSATPFTSSVNIVDDDIAGITISGDTDGSTPITTSETDAGDDTTNPPIEPTVKTFNVVLDTKPTSNVAVYVGSSNSEEGLLSDADETTPEDVVKLVFYEDDWDTPQTVTLTPVDDEIDDGDIGYKIITTVISDDIFYQEDEDLKLFSIEVENSFDSSTDNSISLQVDDLDISQAKLAAGTQLAFSNGAVLTVNENSSIYNSKFADVNLTLDTIASQVDVGTTVTTTDINGNTVELIVATAYDGENGTIGLKSNEESSVQVLANTQMIFNNGASGIFTVRFLQREYFYPNFATEVDFSLQSYTVTDTDTSQFQETTISPDISVTNTDNDTAAVIVDKYDISSSEGYGNNFFNVQLKTKPVGEVTVTMNPVDASGDKDYNISLDDEFDGESYSVTFDETDWNLAKAVKVIAVDDYDIEYNHTSYIDFAVSSTEDSSYNAVTPPDNIIVKIEDNDLPNAGIQAVAAATEAGSPGYFVVTLDNPAPAGFDGTGIVVDYIVSGTVDVDGSGETDDLKPLTGSVRIAPGETRSPIIAFPIDDFKAESIPLEVTNVSGNTVTLEIDTIKLSEIQKESLIEVGTVTIDVGTELTFTNGAIANVIDSNNNNNYQLTISADGGVTSEDVEIEFTSDITTIENGDSTSIPKEMVVVSLLSGSDYSINESEPPSATLSIQDNDKPGVRIVEIGESTVVNENGTAEFYISLLSQPEEEVTISLAGVPTTRGIVVDQAYSSGATTIQLKVDDSEVNSLLLPADTYTLGNTNVTVSNDTTLFSDKFTEVAVSSLSSNITANDSFTYSYTELGFDNTYTFNSNNWYKLQTVTVKGIDDAVAETGDFHTSTVKYTVSSEDTDYDGFEVAPQTINIIDRTFDAENTTESLIEGFFALQDGLDSVTLPIIGSLNGVAPSFIEEFIGDLVTEIKQTEYITAESLQNTFNNVLSGRFGIVNVEITDLSYNNIEFFVDIEDSFTESISIDGDLGLPALGIGIESDGSLDASFDYGIDLAFGINTDDGFYINTEDTGFEVAASFGFSEDFSATGKLGFLQLDVANGDNVGGTGIDAEFVISLEDADTSDDANSDEEAQLTLSELNSLRKSDKLFDSIKYGFSGDAALDLDITTSIEGNTGFPSFGFNLSSELPLFNYSNSDDAEELENAEVTFDFATGTLSKTSETEISIQINDRDKDDTNNSDIILNKGTELTFYSDNDNNVQIESGSVVLQKRIVITEGGEAESVKVKLADDSVSTTITDNATAKLVSGDFNLKFSDITLDLGGFVTDLMSPIISYVNELIEPFEPIIDVLQTEIELLETLDLVDMFDENDDGSATLIEVASTLATTFGSGNLKYQKFFDAVTGIIDLVDTINDLEETISSGEDLGVDFGDYELQNFAAAGDEDVSEVDTSDAANSDNSLNSNVKNSAKNKGGSVKTKVKNFFSKLDDLGIGIPLLEDPLTAINLFLGKDVDLVTYDIPELDIEFSIEQSFPIFGSIKGLLEGGFSLYSDLVVGFDTYGLSRWKELDFALEDSYLISDGFYLSDVDPDTGEDVDELTLDATIAAGVSASAVVAKAEVKGGITGTAALDIIDGGEFTGTSDGKLRGSEVLEADSLLDLFSLSGSLDAFVKALVKVGIDLGFYEIMKTVWSEEFSVTLFEFELNNTSGKAAQSYIEGATVFFDANLNGTLEEGEPVTTSNADGSYNLEIPLLFFDTNDNGKIDPEEGRIVTEGGTDSSSGVAIETPLIAPYGAKMVTPLTTLKQKLIEDGSTPEEAEQLIKEALELPEDIKLEEFDPLAAMSKGDERGTKVYKAHVQMQSLFTQTSEYIKGFGQDELVDEKRPIPEQAIEAIAKGIGKRKGKPPINFSDSTELEELIKEPLEGKFKPKPGERPQRLPESFGILAQTVASGNREIDEVFKGVPPQDILGKVAPVKQITQDKLPKQLRKLVGGARREDITSLLERVPDAEQFLLKEQSQPGEPPTNGGEKPEDKNPLPVVDSEDDTIIPIAPRKPKKLAKGKRPRNLLELDGDDLTDTKIKFSLSSKNLPEGRIHEIAIFTTEDEEGTINGINPEDANYKQAALNKARSIFSILPDDFIANPKRIMKGFADQNIGFLLIKNGTVDSARRGRTSLDSVLLGSETQGDSFRRMQISEKSENSFRLSFEDGMGDADFTDIVIDAELTDETPEIGTDIQGESEGEMLDLRDYAGKQIQIQAPIVREESEYENVVGFYVVEDENGAVRDPLTGNLFNPGEEGYIKAALRNSQNNAFQMGEQGIGGSKEIKGGQIFAPFAIADGTLEEVLDDNPDNDPQVYFAHIGANTDGVDHIRNLGGNTWGVEDMLGGGDMDFNDIVFKLDVTVS